MIDGQKFFNQPVNKYQGTYGNILYNWLFAKLSLFQITLLAGCQRFK